MTRKPGPLPCASALAQARSGGRFTATHERSWQCARLRLGDRDGARPLVEVLLLDPRLPFASAHAALDTATRLGAVDPALVAIEARRIADGRRESGVVERLALSASTARRRTWPATPRSSPGARDEHAHDRAGGRADDRGDLARAARPRREHPAARASRRARSRAAARSSTPSSSHSSRGPPTAAPTATSGSTRSLSGCARRAASPWSALRGIPAYAGRVVATAVNADGKREVLGIDVGTSEDGGEAGRPCAAWWHEGSPAWSW